jgi:hypothetical protein
LNVKEPPVENEASSSMVRLLTTWLNDTGEMPMNRELPPRGKS